MSRAVQASGTTCRLRGRARSPCPAAARQLAGLGLRRGGARGDPATPAPVPVATVTSAQAERKIPARPRPAASRPSRGGRRRPRPAPARAWCPGPPRIGRTDSTTTPCTDSAAVISTSGGRPAGHVHDEVVHGRPGAALDDVDAEDVRALGTERRGQGPEGAGPVGQHHAQQVGHGPPRPPETPASLPTPTWTPRAAWYPPRTRRILPGRPPRGRVTITRRLPANLVEARVGAVLDWVFRVRETQRSSARRPGRRPLTRRRAEPDPTIVHDPGGTCPTSPARSPATTSPTSPAWPGSPSPTTSWTLFAGQLDVILDAVAAVGEVAADDIPPTRTPCR